MQTRSSLAPEPQGVASVSGIIERLYATAAEARRGPRLMGRMLLVDDAGSAERILKAPDVFLKEYTNIMAVATSRFDRDGAEWESRRALTQPTYLQATRGTSRAAIREEFERKLAALSRRDGAGISDCLLAASAVIFHRAFGFEVPGEEAVPLFERLRAILRVMQHLALFGARPADLDALAASGQEIRAAFASWGGASNPFERFTAALPDHAKGIADFDPLGEYLMNFFAGAETTAATMGWTLDRLGASGDWQDRIYEELRRDGESKLLGTFINETLRYFPPIPLLVRRAGRDVELAGRSVRQGQVVLLSIIGLHHDPAYWDSPRQFRPARGEFAENSYSRRAFLPFSMGTRVCGGAGLARLELMEGMAAVVRRFRITRGPAPVRFDYALALRPASQEHLSVQAR